MMLICWETPRTYEWLTIFWPGLLGYMRERGIWDADRRQFRSNLRHLW